MKFLILGILVFVSSMALALASVDGRWAGSGGWIFDGDGVGCPSMAIEFSSNEKEFSRGKGKFVCEFVTLHSDPLTWQIGEGGRLFLDGVEAGSISESEFRTVEPYNDEGTMVHTHMVVSGNKASYEERWIGSDGREIYLIQGEFTRK